MDELNIISTYKDITNAALYLNKEFDMKDLEKTIFCLGIQVENLSLRIFVHQSTHKKNLDRFYLVKSHPQTKPMVFRSFEDEKDPFRPRKPDEDVHVFEVSYLGDIGALMYLTNNT